MVNKRKQEINRILDSHGYTSQTTLAKTLQEKGYYQKSPPESLRAYICQVINEKHPASKELQAGLKQVTDNDQRLQQILTSNPNTDALYSVFRAVYIELEDHYNILNREGKPELLLKLEELKNIEPETSSQTS